MEFDYVTKIGEIDISRYYASLTKLYNECIEESQCPLDWKKGEWIPVFKKDNKQKKENYRPLLHF
jgi:hypothetical protein